MPATSHSGSRGANLTILTPERDDLNIMLDIPTPVNEVNDDIDRMVAISRRGHPNRRARISPDDDVTFLLEDKVIHLKTEFDFADGSATLMERQHHHHPTRSESSVNTLTGPGSSHTLSHFTQHTASSATSIDEMSLDNVELDITRPESNDQTSHHNPLDLAALADVPYHGDTMAGCASATLQLFDFAKNSTTFHTPLTSTFSQSEGTTPPVPQAATFPRRRPVQRVAGVAIRPGIPLRSAASYNRPRAWPTYHDHNQQSASPQRTVSAVDQVFKASSSSNAPIIKDVAAYRMAPVRDGFDLPRDPFRADVYTAPSVVNADRRRSVSLMCRSDTPNIELYTTRPLPALPLMNIPIPPIPVEKRKSSLLKKTSQGALRIAKKISKVFSGDSATP